MARDPIVAFHSRSIGRFTKVESQKAGQTAKRTGPDKSEPVREGEVFQLDMAAGLVKGRLGLW